MEKETLQGYPLKFQPIPQERIWGGQKLPTMFGLDPENIQTNQIGEIWTLSDHPSHPSICLNGPLAGQPLHDIIHHYPHLYLGKSWTNAHPHSQGDTSTNHERFPLLIKFLHAEDDLSVQIHPDDEYALEHEQDFGKTEAWYILNAEEEARIVYGHHFTDGEEYQQAVEKQTVKDYLRYEHVHQGDFIFVPSRTLHALLKGTMVIEIQQSSDVTYRVYDWDRVDNQGRSRELHIDKAADVMTYEKADQSPPTSTKKVVQDHNVTHMQMLECPYFTIERIEVNDLAYTFPLGKTGNPDVLVVVEGEGELIYNHSEQPHDGLTPSKNESLPLKQGDTILIPSNLSTYSVQGKLSLLRTFY